MDHDVAMPALLCHKDSAQDMKGYFGVFLWVFMTQGRQLQILSVLETKQSGKPGSPSPPRPTYGVLSLQREEEAGSEAINLLYAGHPGRVVDVVLQVAVAVGDDVVEAGEHQPGPVETIQQAIYHTVTASGDHQGWIF